MGENTEIREIMADFIGLSTYQELDPSKKNIPWANEVITQFRRDWTRLFNINDARKNREYLFSAYSTARIEKMFKDKEFKELVEFIPVAVWESIRNVLISELTKFPPKVRIKASDPTALQLKEKDLDILKNRNIIQNDLGAQNQKLGLPPYKVPYDKFNSNISVFDEMGLNEDDEDDLGIFKTVWHKLLSEIEGQNLINVLIKTNKFEEMIKLFVNDILAVKATAYQAYVSKITGEIKFRHLFPEVCYGLTGDRPDMADAVCLGWQDTVTVRDFLDYVGNQFDWDRDWRQLLWALNYCNGQKYVGFIKNGKHHYCEGFGPEYVATGGGDGVARAAYDGELLEWNLAYNYKVFQGYIEWKSIDANSYKVSKRDPLQSFTVPYNYQISPAGGYQKENYYDEVTYCSTFLATSTTSQFLYGFGKLYHQRVEGQYDEYSNYSISIYREEGISAVEMSKPYIDLACSAFYKMYWAVMKAKPDSDVFWIEELIRIAQGFDVIAANGAPNQAGGNQPSRLQDMINYQRENFVRIRSYPKVDGKTILQPPSTNDKQHNGLDPIAIAMQSVVQWAEQNVKMKVGINDLREGFSPDPKDGYKINQQATIASRNATGYVDRMLQYVIQNTVNTAIQFTQDIIRFKDSQPYGWLLRLVGTTTTKAIENLELYSTHRLGLFITTYNSEIERQKVEQLVNKAQDNKEITAEQAFIVNTIEDYEKAGYVLAYLKKKEQKRQQRIIQQEQDFKRQLAQQEHNNKMEQITTQGRIDAGVEQIRADASKYVADKGYQGRVDTKQIQVQSDPQKQSDKVAGQIALESHKQNLKEQVPYGEPAGA